MNCLACGTEDSRVAKSFDDGDEIRRMRQCPCGARWATTETSLKRTLVVTNGDKPPPITRNQPPVATNSDGGVGGGLSSDPSVSDLIPPSGSLEDPSSEEITRSDQTRDPSYSDDFLRFWVEYPKKKAKGAAWKAWRRWKPSLEVVLAALRWQKRSDDWTKEGGTYVPHPATYINARQWEDEPTGRPSTGPFYRNLNRPA